MIASRHAVLLEEVDGSTVTAEAEMGVVACVYVQTIQKRSATGATLEMSDEQRKEAADRMAAGLRAMGGRAEVA